MEDKTLTTGGANKLRYFKLHNTGAFVARIAVRYRKSATSPWSEYEQCGYHDICASAERTLDLSETQIPVGAQVELKAEVVAGKDKVSTDIYVYDKASGKTAAYKISGTTLIDKLTLEHYG